MTRIMSLTIGLCMCISTSVAGQAGSRSTSTQACSPSDRVFFEFEVDQPAVYSGDTTRLPRPARDRFMSIREHPEIVFVQFVVDTLGVPVPRSFHVLQTNSAVAADTIRAALPDWRFIPAKSGSCPVSQLVQTAVLH